MTEKQSEVLDHANLGDKKAFAMLYEENSEAVYRFILTFVKSEELADDLCQEVFIKFWSKYDVLPQLDSVKAYLFAIAKNHTINAMKRIAREKDALHLIFNERTDSNSTEDALLTKEYMKFLNDVILGLSPQSREVFRLCRQQHKSYDEVAAMLGISRNAVKKHMVKSMKIISSAVQKDLGLPLGMVMAMLTRL